MSASYHRRGYGYRRASHDFNRTAPTIQQYLRALVQKVRARALRLWTSPAERRLLLGQCRQFAYRVFPWPPIVEVLLILLWVRELNWGERTAFPDAVSQCAWSNWESWPAGASPYHIALVADPQLVDPHTYPGRPWPLSTLTIKHTDQYLRRSFETILGTLHPSSVLFLGDLFDGGREWSTLTSQSPEKRYRSYGDKYWLQEYARFGRIFVDPWMNEIGTYGGDDRRFEANMPGNHDLGIANGVQLPVRDRYKMFFGDGNRIQVLANHTVVTVDLVSLSAKVEQDAHQPIWDPTEVFLNQAKRKKAEIVQRELRTRSQQNENRLWSHTVVNTSQYQSQAEEPGAAKSPELPTILLTHVPLYREPGTPCGPLREKYPPSKSSDSGEPLASDDANSIKVQRGYQYQNVLHPSLTQDLIEKIGGISYVFSGDDHDYCEVVHRGYTAPGGGIREITVKSISWAMGVRHPGIVLLSLWNPLLTDAAGHPVVGTGQPAGGTLQSHLCLLPDQLGIFLSYLKLLILTAILLVANAIFWTVKGSGSSHQSTFLLPVDQQQAYKMSKLGSEDESVSYSSAHSSDGTSTSLRAANGTRPRTGPMSSPVEDEAQKKYQPGFGLANGSLATSRAASQPRKRMVVLWHLFRSLRLVVLCGLGWYLHLMWTV